MAVTTESSAELKIFEGDSPKKLLKPYQGWSTGRFAHFSFQQGGAAGDANSIARLHRTPPGPVAVMPSLWRLVCSAFGAARVLSLGWEEYVDQEGKTVAGDPTGIVAGLDVSTAQTVAIDAGHVLFSSWKGVVITARVTGGTIPAGATLKGHIALVHD